TLAAHETLLDQHGEATKTLQLPKDADLVFGELRVEGVVSSARGKSVSHSTSQPFSARDRFIGLRTNHWMQTAKESFTVDYIVTDEHGKLQSDQEVQLALEREEVHRVREKTAGGDYGNKEETEWVGGGMCEGGSTGAPEACSFTPQA